MQNYSYAQTYAETAAAYSRELVYAGFWARFAAHLIDLALVFAVQMALRLALLLSFSLLWENNPLDYTFLFQYTWKDALLYAAGAAYLVLCTYYTGTTVGKRAMNLKVISADGEKLSFLNVLYRETVGRFLAGFVLGAGYIMAGLTREKTGLHDILCDTRVVYARKIPDYEAYAARTAPQQKARNTAFGDPAEPVQSAVSAQPKAPVPSAEPSPSVISAPPERHAQPETLAKPAIPVQPARPQGATGTLYDMYRHVDVDGPQTAPPERPVQDQEKTEEKEQE